MSVRKDGLLSTLTYGPGKLYVVRRLGKQDVTEYQRNEASWEMGWDLLGSRCMGWALVQQITVHLRAFANQPGDGGRSRLSFWILYHRPNPSFSAGIGQALRGASLGVRAQLLVRYKMGEYENLIAPLIFIYSELFLTWIISMFRFSFCTLFWLVYKFRPN